jgi:hypothetical protein
MTLLPRAEKRDLLEASLIDFVKSPWPSIDPG